MSHDMRTPLGAIMAESEFGLEEVKDTTAQKYFAHIKASSQYLFSIINDILEQEKMDNGTLILKRQVFELAPFHQSVKTIISQKAEEKNITQIISCNYTPEISYVKLDESRLEQVLINLLSNAIKYTRENGTIEWGCDYLHKNNKNYLIYKIKDNGVGMSKAFQKSMFQPYAREINALSSFEGGTGLGLSIVKRILDAGGQTITCQSTLSKGSLFTVEIQLPLVSEEEKKILQNKIIRLDESKLDKAKILVVDDIEINRTIVQKILEKKGCIITCATNGLEAIDLVKKGSFDIVLMDIKMPVMSGLEAVKTIRLFNKEIPIIALSANAFSEDITISIKAGMNDHLAKPINRNKLMELLIKYLKA
jgi:CheY-like chemotaxis protein/two-component sensor histidine kinase